MAGGSVCVMRQISSNKTEGSNYRIWKRSTGQRRQCGCFKNISSIVTGLLQLYFSSLFSFCCIFVRFIPFLSYSISIFVSTRGRRTVKHQTERTEKRPKTTRDDYKVTSGCQQSHLSLLVFVLLEFRLMTPGKSLLNSSTSESCCNPFLATVWNACSTFSDSLADVSKYGMLFFDIHQPWARFTETCCAAFELDKERVH